jgi:hypothetical protein
MNEHWRAGPPLSLARKLGGEGLEPSAPILAQRPNGVGLR